MKKWRLYFVDDDRCEYVWQTGAPTTCPTNALHTVRQNSIDVAATVTQFKRLSAHNSPFSVTNDNFFVVDTTDSNVNVSLPTASGKNNGKLLYFVKETGSNSIIVAAADGELIDNSVQPKTVVDSLKLVSNGTDGWSTISIRDTDGTADDEQIDTKKRSGADIWIFQSRVANSLNGGTNVANSWATRSFNQMLLDGGSDIQFLSSNNTFVLQQGCYRFHAECVFYRTDFTRVRLFNVSDGVTEAVSLNAFAGTSGSFTVTVKHFINVDSIEPKTFRLEYFCTRLQYSNGLGRANGTGDAELYAIVRFIKN